MIPRIRWIANGHSSHNRPLLFALALAMGCALPAQGFLIYVHKDITEEALASFPATAMSDWERQQIVLGVADADLMEGGLPFTSAPYDSRFHFDDDFSYRDVARNYASMAEILEDNLAKHQPDPRGFGKILHAFEDFYSHSNYVLLYRQYRNELGKPVDSIPTLEEVMLEPEKYAGFVSLLHTDLRTGRYPDHAFRANDTDHGKVLGTGMHKDVFYRTSYREAYAAASRAASWYINLYRRDAVTLNNFNALKAKGFLSTI